MLWNLWKLLAAGYLLVLTVAAGGFVGANVAGLIPVMGEQFFDNNGRALRPETHLRWMHGGWLVGAAIFSVGGVLEARRRRTAKRTATSTGDDADRRRKRQARLASYPSPRTLVGSAAVGSIIGGFLGMILGGTFLLLWFALAYSPLSPPSWGASVAVESDRRVRGEYFDAPRHTTRHPIALYAFFAPAVLGLVSGALFGGIVKIKGQVSTMVGKPVP